LGKGWLYGNPAQFKIQLIAVGTTIVYTGVVTAIIFLVIKYTVGIRAKPEEEMIGLDQSEHGETAYNL